MSEDYADEDVLAIAGEVECYLLEHPNAADSLEGISKWWLAGSQAKCSAENVQKALDYLVATGVVRRVAAMGMQTVYARGDGPVEKTRH